MRIIYPSYPKILHVIKRGDYKLHFNDLEDEKYDQINGKIVKVPYIVKNYYCWVYVHIITNSIDETVTLYFEGYHNTYYIKRIDYVGADIKPNRSNINLFRICKELQLQNPQYEFNSWSPYD
jgi:hypothetical protein